MKRYKKVWILLGVLVLCCAAAFAVTKIEEQKENIQQTNHVILALSSSQVQSLSWKTDNSELGFHRDENRIWKWDSDETFPVDNNMLSDMLGIFESFTAVFTIEQPEDISQYGLSEPEGTIQLSTADKTYTVTMGAFSTLDAQRYVSIGDGNVYLVSADPLDTCNVEISSLIDHDEIPLIEQADTITFTGEKGYTVSCREDANASYCAEDVYFSGEKPLSTDEVETYLFNLSYTELTDYVSYNATEEELSQYGLLEPALSVQVNYTTENEDETTLQNTFTLHIGLVNGVDEEGAATTVGYGRVGDSGILYQLRLSDQVSLMAYTYDDLRHSEVFTADFATVTAMDITVEDTAYALVTATVAEEETGESEESEETEEAAETVWKYSDAEIDISAIQAALEALRFDGFTSEAASGQEELRIVLHLQGEYMDTMEIVLYRLDGINCLCTVNGESIGYVSRSYTVDLIEAVNAIVLN